MNINLETALEECRPTMYLIFRRYNIDGYDSDDLFQEAIVWILRDWDKISNMEDCKVNTAIINISKWVCGYLKHLTPKVKKVEFREENFCLEDEKFSEHDISRLLHRAKTVLSAKAFAILYMKLKPTEFGSTKRNIQKTLRITNRSYDMAIKKIRKFLNAQGIYSNRK